MKVPDGGGWDTGSGENVSVVNHEAVTDDFANLVRRPISEVIARRANFGDNLANFDGNDGLMRITCFDDLL